LAGPAQPDEQQRVATDARKALALLMRGRTEAGFELYGQCLRSGFAADLPVGLHLLFLEKAGKTQVANRLRELAAGLGADIVAKGVAIATDEQTAAEYETWLERGLINTRMVEAYLLLLARLGRGERIEQLCDPRRLLRIERAGSGELAAAIEALLLRREADARYRETDQSVRRQRQIDPLQKIDDPSVARLLSELHGRVASYLAEWAAGDHPLARYVPTAFELEAWALISRGDGYNVPHVHSRGWATGVYYPTGLDDALPGGELCVGPPEGVTGDLSRWPHAKVRPEAGLLVLIPSYYLHWTLPLAGPGLRTAVAFDVVGGR